MEPNPDNAPGCREVAFGTLLVLGLAAVFVAVGLTLTARETCTGACETLALTLLYAGGPISALFGVVFGGVTLAWPLEVTFWVVIGFAVARWAGSRSRSTAATAVAVMAVALVYGLVLSQFVEIAVPE